MSLSDKAQRCDQLVFVSIGTVAAASHCRLLADRIARMTNVVKTKAAAPPPSTAHSAYAASAATSGGA